MNKRKTTGFRIETKPADGSCMNYSYAPKSEQAIDEAHAEGARMAPGKRSWRQPEVFVYEQFSDESSELVYYEYYARPHHRA